MILPVFSHRQNSYNARHVKKEEIIMLTAKKLEEIAKQVTESIPASLKNIAHELEDKAKTVLQSKLSQLDVVTREEFDVQTQVLLKTRAQLTALETKLAALEEKIAASK